MKRILIILLLTSAHLNIYAQIIRTFAGNGCNAGSPTLPGCYSGDGGPATDAGLCEPSSVRLDSRGNVYIADAGNNRVRKVNLEGIISTVAGNGLPGYAGDGGPATDAKLYTPMDMDFDRYGNMYIADGTNGRIRKVDTLGNITTIWHLPEYQALVGILVDAIGNIYFTDWNGPAIYCLDTAGGCRIVAGMLGVSGFSGDGGLATHASFDSPCYLAKDREGNLYIADASNGRIRRVDNDGTISTFAGIFGVPVGVAVDDSGNVYTGEQNADLVHEISPFGVATIIAGIDSQGYTGDGGPATACTFDAPQNLCVDPFGRVYIADCANNVIREIIFPEKENVKIFEKFTFNMFPNPVQKELTITSQAPVTSVTICNLLGQVVYSKQYNSPHVQVDVADLPTGVYLIKINGTEVRKFVKE